MPPDERNPFSYHKPDDSLMPKIVEVIEAFKACYDVILKTLPTRERAIAVTKLEEAAMWAIKGVVLPPMALGAGGSILAAPNSTDAGPGNSSGLPTSPNATA